jgi:hypothetical protein
MKKRIAWLRSIVVITALGMVLAGCAFIQKSDATDTEQMLAAAGFNMKLADTPAKAAHLQTLTQRKLVSHERAGKVYFVYADADYCKCLYVGNQENYQRYNSMSVNKNIAEMNENAADMNEDALMDWGMWGPWGAGW